MRTIKDIRQQFGMLAIVAIALSLFSMAAPSASFAVPTLQLQILGDNVWYDTTTDTTLTSDSSFQLVAFLTPGNGAKPTEIAAMLAKKYYISIAVDPRIEQTNPEPDFGSFTYDGNTVNVTSDMNYGTPPLDELYPNLGTHSQYPTYYKEVEVMFSAANQVNPYDVEDNTNNPLVAGTGMYYVALNINISGLDPSINLHFDLYDEVVKSKPNGVTIYDTQFAPFSHDAGTTTPTNPVPEPGTVILLGIGLAGLAILGRKRITG